jgi:hypothetical protein
MLFKYFYSEIDNKKIKRPDQELNLDILAETTFPGLRLTIGPSGHVQKT